MRQNYSRVALIAAIAALSIGHGYTTAHAQAVVGKITQVTGKAQVKRNNVTLDAVAEMPVQLHDQLNTETPGELTLQLLDKSILTLNESSTLSIDENVISNGVRATTSLGLLSGTVQSVVTKVARTAGPSFKLSTPNAIAGVRGTNFSCRYNAGKARAGFPNCFEFTDCATNSGSVVVTNNPPRSGVAVQIGPGQKTTVACLAAPLAASPGTLGVLGGGAASGAAASGAAASGGILGPAAIVGAGLGAAAVIGGITVGVVESTSGGGGSGGGTVSPSR